MRCVWNNHTHLLTEGGVSADAAIVWLRQRAGVGRHQRQIIVIRMAEQQLTTSVKTKDLQTVQSDDGRSTWEKRGRRHSFFVSLITRPEM